MDDLRERFERLRADLDRQGMPDLRPSANRPESDWRPTTQSLGARIAIVVGALAIALGALTFVWSAFRNDENTVQPGPAAETSALWALSRAEDQSGPPEVWLYTIDPVDGDTRLIADLKETTYAALSPNGRDIVFTQVGQDRGLWITDVDGRRPERLYQATPNNVFNPVWSPDGAQIVFGNNRKGHDELFLIRPDGTGLRQLTTNEEGGDFLPSWSADGSQIAFVRNAGGPIGLYRVDVESGDVQVVANPLGATESAWSPDGRSIVVSVAGAMPPGIEAVPGLHDLYRVDLASGDQSALTDTLGEDERSPVFSTDGTLAYVRRSGDSFEVVSSGQGTASANSQPFGEPGELVQLGWYTLGPEQATSEDGLPGTVAITCTPNGTEVPPTAIVTAQGPRFTIDNQSDAAEVLIAGVSGDAERYAANIDLSQRTTNTFDIPPGDYVVGCFQNRVDGPGSAEAWSALPGMVPVSILDPAGTYVSSTLNCDGQAADSNFVGFRDVPAGSAPQEAIKASIHGIDDTDAIEATGYPGNEGNLGPGRGLLQYRLVRDGATLALFTVAAGSDGNPVVIDVTACEGSGIEARQPSGPSPTPIGG